MSNHIAGVAVSARLDQRVGEYIEDFAFVGELGGDEFGLGAAFRYGRFDSACK